MNIFSIIQIVVSVLLVVVIIMQSRGTQGGAAFGSYGETYRSKKGLERLLFYSTIVLAALFASISILAILI
jgi:protein translocase SecG subunit